MTTTMASATSPPSSQQNTPSTNLSVLPPIVTDSHGKRQSGQRPSSFGKDRLSVYSNVSIASQNRSRPGSHVFPIFHSSLPYALVRDFAYPSIHPLHYGPLPPRASSVSTPVSEQRRLSDPPAPWDSSRGQWSTSQWSTDHSYGHQQLPAMSFGDGPPYSEDEDLHSPVFSVPQHRKNKSTGTELNGRRGPPEGDSADFRREGDRGMLVSMNADGSETYYVNGEDATEDGPGGDFVTYPANESRYSYIGPESYGHYQGYEHDAEFESEDDYDPYSRDFQFSVGCPDEEMHGKAVALFDFTREHENELPLKEGQVIFVSYRHGQGWLVAEDPKTGESGLVPEEFVRLLRDIEGGLTSLNGDSSPESGGNDTYVSPKSTESEQAITQAQDDQLPSSSDKESASETKEDDSGESSTGGGEANSNTSHLQSEQGIDTAPLIEQQISRMEALSAS